MTGTWRLTYPGVTQDFGDSGIFLRRFPMPGAPELQTQDGTYPQDDGGTVGVDLQGGVTVPMTFGVDGRTELEVRDNWDRLAAVWSGDAIRNRAGAVAELRSDRGRSSLGRPRRIAPTVSDLDGTPPSMTLEAEWWAVDSLWYGPWTQKRVGLSTRGGTGIKFPLRFPFRTTPPAVLDDEFTVGGSKPTWLVVDIEGPITSPVVQVDRNLVYSLRGVTLAFDQTVTIDTRPWSRSVKRNDGASLAGSLDSTSSLLSSGRVAPGRHEFTIRGTSSTGSAHGTVRWRDANATP